MAQNMKQKIFALLTKLGDRDTYSMAARELESMAREIDPASGNLQPFISGVMSTDSDDKPAVRKHCIHLLSILSISLPPDALSPFLPKILTRITRRLRDRDTSIRTACVEAVSSLSSRTRKTPFSSAFLKPLADALFTEQDANAQIGAALCLAAAIDAAPDPDPARLRRVLLPRLEKLMKCEAFKAKAAGLVVIGSVIGSSGVSGAAMGGGGLKGLVDSLVSFLSSEDWAARKAAAEALEKLAEAERDSLAEFKPRCLRVFENRKYDKVKAVRDVMNQMMEKWKEVPDISEDVSPPRSNASSKEDASDGRYPARSKVASSPGDEITKTRRRSSMPGRSTPPDSSLAITARRRSTLKSIEKRNGSASCTKPSVRRSLDWKSGVSVHDSAPRDVEHVQVQETNQIQNSSLTMQKFGGSRPSHVSASSERSFDNTGCVLSENLNSKLKGLEELPSIRNQLVQIEQHQSSLMDVLQKFISSSQNGMQALETRVHGLELALDEISYDLAVSSGRVAGGSGTTTCCLLPGKDFLRPKFWRKTNDQYLASRLSTSANTPSVYPPNWNGNAEVLRTERSRLRRFHGAPGIIVNPLAEIRTDSSGTNGSTGLARN